MTDKKHQNDSETTALVKTDPVQPQIPGPDTVNPEAAQAPPPPAQTGGKGGRGLATLALLIAVGAAGGSGYLWYLWDQDKRAEVSQSAELDNRLQKALAQVAQQRDAELKPLRDQFASQQASNQALQGESQTLKGSVQSLQSAVQGLQSALQAARTEAEIQKGDAQIRKNQIQALQDQLQAFQGNFQGLNDQLNAYTKEQQRNWTQLETRIENVQLAERSLLTTLDNVKTAVARGGDVNALPLTEVEYLLRIADHKLKLQHDVKSAIEALQVAEQRLKGIDESAFLGVQRMIAENIASLHGVDLPDRSALAHKIIEMEQRLSGLPLRNQAQLAQLREKVKPNMGEVGTLSEPSEQSWWERISTTAWMQFKDILVIRRERSDTPPLIAIQEEYFLIQNLRLELEAMRLAILNNDAASFQEANGIARNWLQTYFNTDDPAVSGLLKELQAFQAIQFNPYIPDISGTLQAFGDIMQRRQPVRSVIPSSTVESTGQAPAKETQQ